MINDIDTMHHKFGVHTWMKKKIEEQDYDSLKKFLDFRLDFIEEEFTETQKAVFESNPEEIVDGLIDIIVVALGTLNAFEVDIKEAWNQVHNANMAKEPGIKPNRPNPLGLPDLQKPSGWKNPNHRGNVGTLGLTVHKGHRCNCYSCFMGRGYDV